MKQLRGLNKLNDLEFQELMNFYSIKEVAKEYNVKRDTVSRQIIRRVSESDKKKEDEARKYYFSPSESIIEENGAGINSWIFYQGRAAVNQYKKVLGVDSLREEIWNSTSNISSHSQDRKNPIQDNQKTIYTTVEYRKDW